MVQPKIWSQLKAFRGPAASLWFLAVIIFLTHAQGRAQNNSQLESDSLVSAEISGAISPRREEILTYARSLVGSGYARGAEGPSRFDCSGYTRHVFGKYGIDIPHESQAQSMVGIRIPVSELRPGDLLFFGLKTENGFRIQHAAIVNDIGKELEMIHSSSSQGVIIEGESGVSWQGYWKKRLLFGSRVLE